MEPSFCETRALEALEKLQTHQQLATAVRCCERMLPNYAAFMADEAWGDFATLRTVLDAMWTACLVGASIEVDLKGSLMGCENAAPCSEDFSSRYVSAAQDAVFSVCALIDFVRKQELERIVSVLRFSSDTVDLFIQELEQMDPRDPQREQRILEHPLMQQELIRQRRDLSEVSRLEAGDHEGLRAFRQRSRAEHSLRLESESAA